MSSLPKLSKSLPAASSSQDRHLLPRERNLSHSIRPQKKGFYDASSFGLSNLRIRPLQESFKKISSAVCSFCDFCKLDELRNNFHQFYLSYELFLQYSLAVFNSQHPTDDKHSTLPRSAVMTSTRSMIRRWISFISSLNDVTVGGTLPLFPKIMSALSELTKQLDIVVQYFFVGGLNSKISDREMKSIDDLLTEIRWETMDYVAVLNNKKNGETNNQDRSTRMKDPFEANTSPQGFLYQNYAFKCFDAIRQMQSIFLHQMPNHNSRSGGLMVDKMNFAIALNEFADSVKGLYNFDSKGSEVRNAALEMNDSLSKVFSELGLPFELKMNSQDVTSSCEVIGESIQEPIPPPISRTLSPRRKRSGK